MSHIENIIFHYLSATDSEHSEGMRWYDDANAIARRLSPSDVWRGAGVIAAFSPMTPWPRNLELAESSLLSGIARTDTLGNSTRAAQRIIDGEHVFDVLKGDKTRAFAAAIADPANSTIATIDRHAYNIAMGTMEGQPKIGKRIFRELSDAYVGAANLAGIGVPQMQAITWVAFRNRKGVKV